MPEAFQHLFLPNGQAPPSGLLTTRPDLASVLDAVAVKGISEFYGGNLTQEMVAAVREHAPPLVSTFHSLQFMSILGQNNQSLLSVVP